MSVLLAPSPLVELETLFPAERRRSEDGLYVSLETYWQQYYNHFDFNYEWNNGRLEKNGVSQYVTTELYNWFLELLRHFLRVHQIGKILNLKIGFKLDLPEGQKVRKPDLGIVLNDNPVPIQPTDTSYHGTFDLCLEAISDSTPQEIERDTVVKKKEYAQANVKEYYVLDGTGRETGFYRLNQQGQYEKIKATKGDVIQSEVLRGFQFRISDLYRQPTPKEMVSDQVYRGFIMLDYQAQKERADFAMERAYEEKQRADEEKLKAEEANQRAEEANQRAEEQKLKTEEERQRAEEQKLKAEEERQRAEEERQRAERFLAKLKKLGISLDDL